MKRRDFIKQAVVGAMAMHGLDQKAALADPIPIPIPVTVPVTVTDPVPVNPKGEWPLPGQNSRYLAQAELPCDMPHAPKETWSLDLGRVPIVGAITADVDGDGKPEILYGAYPLVCASLSGKEKWRCDGGEVYAITDIDGDGHTELLVGGKDEHQPQIVRGADGKILWRRTGPGIAPIPAKPLGAADATRQVRFQAAKLLPAVKGLQVATVMMDFGSNGKIAQVWSFEEGCEHGKLAWERNFAPWEYSCSAVGTLYGRPCLVSTTWGGIIVLDAKDGSDLMRLYWEEAPGKGGLRNYGPLIITDLDGDGKAEIAQLAFALSQHIDVFAPHRGSPGAYSFPEKPWPAPAAQHGELVRVPDGPILWRRYFGIQWPQEEFLTRFPAEAIADVDGDGKKEIVALVGREKWELKVYDGMTGEEKLSLSNLNAEFSIYYQTIECAATVFDFDGDGIPEIAVTLEGALVIGNLRDGKWVERARLEGCRLWHTVLPVAPDKPADSFRLQQQPVGLGTGKTRSWVCTRAATDGRPASLVLLTPKPRGEFAVTEHAFKGVQELQFLAATHDRLIATTSDGKLSVISASGKLNAQWACGQPFISQPAVADIDGDGINELVVCKGGGKVAALRTLPGKQAPRNVWEAAGNSPPSMGGVRGGWATPHMLWEVDGTGLLGSTPAAFPTPLIADVNGDGKKEILIVGTGTEGGARLLDHRGKTLWKSEIPGARGAFADLNGDGHPDVYLAAWTPVPHSIGVTLQSFALEGRTGQPLWHNDGSEKIIWHHELGPQHRQPTVWDVNGDGCDDVLFAALDLLTILSGKDGSFIYDPVIANEIWKQQEGKNGQWSSFGTQIPVDLNGDGKVEILLAAGWGQWGAWTMDRKLLWTFNPDKAQLAMRHPGIGDVDGDGKLELGVIHDAGFFRCYDATNGALKWEIPGIKQTTDVVTADIDGDGRPEFLAGLAAFKPIDQTHGRVVWEVNVPAAHSPVVADVDGDGKCEILLCGTDGILRVFKC